MKKAIYTCITGEYDSIMNPSYITPGWDYICFTDIKDLKSDVWEIRQLDTDYESTKKARNVKILVTSYLPDYDITIWVDGNIRPNCNADEFIDTYLEEDSDLGISMHPLRNCIYQEIDACIKLKKDDILTLRSYGQLLKDLEYPPYNGLIQSNVIIRRNTLDVRNFSKRWWKQVKEFSKRDQLSFNYIMHIYPINYNLFSSDILKEMFLLYKHRYTISPGKLKKEYGSNFHYYNDLNGKKTLLIRSTKQEINTEGMTDVNKFLYTKGLEGFDNFKKQVKKK